MEPKENNKGVICHRSQIRTSVPPGITNDAISKIINSLKDHRDLYICICKNKKWRWERLINISMAQIKKYKNNILNPAPLPRGVNEFPIMIDGKELGKYGPEITGTYFPAPDYIYADGNPVYIKPGTWDTHHNHYLQNTCRALYSVKEEGGDGEWKWWVGTIQNMLQRKPWGFWQSEKMDTVTLKFPSSKIWDGVQRGNQRGQWQTCKEFTITPQGNDNPELLALKKKLNRTNEAYNIEKGISEKSLKLVKEMYNRISIEEREKYMNNSIAELFRDTQLCHLCFKIKPLIKCLHFDCVGACEDCRKLEKGGGGGDGTCCACKREQKAECPVCIETHTEQYLKVLPCKHVVCWKCFCNSYECNHPIQKCPRCRSKITT